MPDLKPWEKAAKQQVTTELKPWEVAASKKKDLAVDVEVSTIDSPTGGPILSNGFGPFQTPVNTETPSVLTPEGYTPPEQQAPANNLGLNTAQKSGIGSSLTNAPTIKSVVDHAKDGGALKQQLSDQLNTAIRSFSGAQGEAITEEVLSAQPKDEGVIQPVQGRSGNRLTYTYNKFLQGIGGATSGLIDAGIVMATPTEYSEFSTPESKAQMDEILVDYRKNVAPAVRGFLKENIGADVDKGTERKFDEEFVTGAIGGLAYSVPAMLSPYGIGLYSQSYDSALESINRSQEGQKLSEGQKTLYAGLLGTVIGKLEKTGLERIFGKSAVSTNAMNGLIVKAVDAAKKSNTKLTTEFFENFISKEVNTLAQKFLRAPKVVGGATVIEGVTGGLQELATVGSEKLVNALTDKEVFEPQSLGEMTVRVLKSAGQEALGGGILGGVKSGMNTSVKSDLINRIVTGADVTDDITRIATENGYNEQQIAELAETVHGYQQIIDKIPSTVSDGAKVQIVPLIEERDETLQAVEEENAKEVDPAFKPMQDAKIEILEAKAKELNDEIVKTAETPAQPDKGSQDSTVQSAVIEIGGKLYEGNNHAEAILKAKSDGQDISQVNRSKDGKFKLSDGTIIGREEAKTRFGQDRSELLIPQDEAADQANKDYKSEVKAQSPTQEAEVAPEEEIPALKDENGLNIGSEEWAKKSPLHKKITDILKANGFEVENESSNKSFSEYIKIPIRDEKGNVDYRLKIRVSDHSLPRGGSLANADIRTNKSIQEAIDIIRNSRGEFKALKIPGQSLSAKEPTTTKKTIKQLSEENKSTLPKVPATNVFVNHVEQPARADRAKVDALMDDKNPENDKTSELPIESISITDIIPTQKNLTIPNLESVKGVKEKAVVLKKGDKYFIIDGHHRIANQILNGETNIDAHVYSEDKVSTKVVKVKDFKTDEGNFSVYNIEGNDGRQGDNFTVHKDKDGWIVRNALLPEELRRKGIASDFYTQMNAESLKVTGNPLRSTQPRTLNSGETVHELSPDATAMWDSFVKKGLAEKLGDKDYKFLSIETVSKEAPVTPKAEAEAEPVEESSVTTKEDVAKAVDKKAKGSIKLSSSVQDMKVSDISTDEARFQNREALDKQRVKDIAENFDVNKLDPIVVFQEGDKNTVLSGHHRLASAKLAGIETIPVKVFEGTEQQAKDFAKDSNTLGKQETPSERAKRYRDLRASGEPEGQIRDMAQQAHGSDATLMLNLSRLDPNGKALDAVKSFEKSTDKDTKNKVQAIGDWIGQVKSMHPDLSRRQENEMFDYLLDAYGTKKGGGKVTNRRQFADLADALINRAKGRDGFNEDTVFNFKNAAGKSGLEVEYDATVKEAEQSVTDTNKALSEKRKELLTIGAKKADIDRVLQPFETAVQNAVQDLHNLRKDKGAVQEAVKQQGSIFDIIANDTNLKENDRATREVSEILEQESGTDKKVTGVGEKIPPEAQQPEATKAEEPTIEEKPIVEKVEPTKLQSAKDKLKEAKAKLDNLNNRSGIADDPKEKARALFEYHKALVDVAKEYIKEGVQDVKAFAKELGEKVTKVVQDAWDEATGGKEKTIEDFEEKPDLISDEEANVLGITKQERQRQRAEMGEEQYDYEVKTRSKLEKEADKLLADGFSVPNLIKKLEGGKYAPPAAEIELIRRYYVSLTAKINNSPTPELLAERKELQEILDKTGTRMGQAVQAFDGLMAVEDNLASFLQDEGKYYDLSPEEIQELSEKYNKAKDALEKLQAKNAEALAEAMDKEAQKRLTEARKEAQKRTRASVREDFDVRKKSIADEIRAKLKELRHTPQVTIVPYARELIVIAPLVKKYMDVLVEAKIYDLKQIIKDIHAEFKDDIEGLTEGDVRDIIAGKYPNPRKTKNAKLAEIHDLETQARLEAKIEDLEKGILTTSNPSQRRTKSDRIEELEKQIKEIKRRNPELTAPSKLQGRKTWYTNKVKELRNEVETGVYDPLEPNMPVLLDKEGLKLKDEYATFLKETRERRAKKDYEALNKWQKVGWFGRQLLDIKRLVQTSLDLSIPFRQGIDVMMNIGMPDIRDGKVIWRKGTTSIGVKGYGMMIRSVFDPDGKGLKKATFSDKFYNRMMHDIRSNDAFLESKDDGIVYSEVSSSNSEMRDESHPHENFLYKVQYAGAPLRASERAAAAWLNYTRFELYHRGVKFLLRQGKTRENSKQAYEDMAVRVMTDTGRGKIPLLSDKAPSNEGSVIKQLLGHTLYGTRLYSATFRKLNLLYYMGIKNPFNKGYVVDKTVRVEALKDMIGSTTGYILTTLAVAAATGAVVSLDWDDPDFLKFRKGKKLVDHTGGRSVYIRTFLRLVNAVYNHADPTVSHQDAVKYSNFAKKSLESFWRNKLAPNTSYGVNAFMGQNTIGEKFNPYEIIQIYPMYTDDLISAFKESPLDAAIILPIGISGLGYQEYSRDIKKARVSLYISPKDKELKSFLKKHQLNITGDINQEVFDLEAWTMVKMTPDRSSKYEKIWAESVIEGIKAEMPELEKMAVIDKKHEDDKGYHDKVTAKIGQIKSEATKIAKEAVGGVATSMLTLRKDDKEGNTQTFRLSKEQVLWLGQYVKDYTLNHGETDRKTYDEIREREATKLIKAGKSKDQAMKIAEKIAFPEAEKVQKGKALAEARTKLYGTDNSEARIKFLKEAKLDE